MPRWAQTELRSELQRLLTLLDCKTGQYNIETRFCKNGKSYIMEVSPRAGGNRLAEMLKYVTGEDIIERAMLAAVSEPFKEIIKGADECENNILEIILHANKSGVFKRIELFPKLEARVIEKDLWVKSGDMVESFSGANMAIGTLALQISSNEDTRCFGDQNRDFLKVEVE